MKSIEFILEQGDGYDIGHHEGKPAHYVKETYKQIITSPRGVLISSTIRVKMVVCNLDHFAIAIHLSSDGEWYEPYRYTIEGEHMVVTDWKPIGSEG